MHQRDGGGGKGGGDGWGGGEQNLQWLLEDGEGGGGKNVRSRIAFRGW